MNNLVKVRLTPSGIKAYIDFHKGWSEPLPLNENKEVTLQLWELFQIFGDKFFVNCEIPFEDNIINIEEFPNE